MESARCDPDPRGAKKSLKCATGYRIEERRRPARGRPLPRRREMVSVYGRQRLRGTAALQAATDHRCHQRMVIAGRSPGGRPLRRRREMVSVYGRQRLRGTAALQASIGHRCHQRMVIAGRLLEGARSLGAVKRCQFTAGNGCEGPQPSRSLPIIVATNEWSLLADSWSASAPSAP